jgi:hypothetical protein
LKTSEEIEYGISFLILYVIQMFAMKLLEIEHLLAKREMQGDRHELGRDVDLIENKS